jgi:hypothetical protein
MQKRAELQMHQANMRAQLYHYQQQHYYLQQHYAPHQRAHSLDSYNHYHPTAKSAASTTSPLSNGLMDHQQRQSVPPTLFPYAEISNTDFTTPQGKNKNRPHETFSAHFSLSPSLPVSQSTTTTIDPTHLTSGSPTFGLSITSLTIGRWHRLKMQPQDLTCVYQPEQQALCWHIEDGQHTFKMEMPLATIQQLTYTSSSLFIETSLLDQDALPAMGELQLDLFQPPRFYIKNQDEWTLCIDFTEYQQGTQVLQHTLKGIGLTLWQELSTLITACPETQPWIKMISSPTCNSSISSSNSSVGDASSYMGDGMVDFLSSTIGTDDYNLLSTQLSPGSLFPTPAKSDEPLTAVDDFLIDPSLLDPSLWTSNGFILS